MASVWGTAGAPQSVGSQILQFISPQDLADMQASAQADGFTGNLEDYAQQYYNDQLKQFYGQDFQQTGMDFTGADGQVYSRLGYDPTQPGSTIFAGLPGVAQYDQTQGWIAPKAYLNNASEQAASSGRGLISNALNSGAGLMAMAGGLGALGPLAGLGAAGGATGLEGVSFAPQTEFITPGLQGGFTTGGTASAFGGGLGAAEAAGVGAGGALGASEALSGLGPYSPTGLENVSFTPQTDFITPSGSNGVNVGSNFATGGTNTAFGGGTALGGTAATGASTLQNLMNGKGIQIGDTNIPNNVLAGAGQAALGYFGANQQSNALENIYNQTRADRLPALNAYNNALANPDSFYNSAPAMGATDAVLRRLSVNGNPALNPGDISKAASYSLGGYNDYLRGLTPAAFGTASTEANLGAGVANAEGGGLNAIGYGLGTALNPQPNLMDLIKQMGGINFGKIA